MTSKINLKTLFTMPIEPPPNKLSLQAKQFEQAIKGPATRNDFVNDIVDDARADAIFATLKTIVDDGSSTISSTISLRVAGPLVVCSA